LSTIKTQIEDIISKYDEVETKVETTNEEALAALANDGIAEPTEAQVIEKLDQLNKEKLDAIQEPSTEEIPVQEQPGVSEEVVEEVPIEQEPAQEGEQEVGFVTTPSIKEPFILTSPSGKPSNTQVNFTEDGKVESIVNKKQGKK